MENTKKYLVGFFEKNEFPEKAIVELCSALDKIVESKEYSRSFLEIISRYGDDVNIDYKKLDEDISALAAASDIHNYTLNMLAYVAMTKRLREHYISRGIALSVFDRSMLDFKYKLVECMEIYGVAGTFVTPWLAGFLRLIIFGLGRLQFEVKPLGINCVVDGTELAEDSPAINVHIPRTGGKLGHQEVTEAYKMAAEFFKESFCGKPVVFMCISWLLWKEHLNMLPPEANMCKFIGDYTIIKNYDYKDYRELWRLFDKNYDGNPDNLPADSTLRRKYIEHIKEGKPTGSAWGVFIYK